MQRDTSRPSLVGVLSTKMWNSCYFWLHIIVYITCLYTHTHTTNRLTLLCMCGQGKNCQQQDWRDASQPAIDLPWCTLSTPAQREGRYTATLFGNTICMVRWQKTPPILATSFLWLPNMTTVCVLPATCTCKKALLHVMGGFITCATIIL